MWCLRSSYIFCITRKQCLVFSVWRMYAEIHECVGFECPIVRQKSLAISFMFITPHRHKRLFLSLSYTLLYFPFHIPNSYYVCSRCKAQRFIWMILNWSILLCKTKVCTLKWRSESRNICFVHEADMMMDDFRGMLKVKLRILKKKKKIIQEFWWWSTIAQNGSDF